MNEQVIIKMDKELKKKVMKKAKQEGSTLSAVFKNVARAYVRNEFAVGLAYNPKLIRDIRKAEKEPTVRGDLRQLLRKY